MQEQDREQRKFMFKRKEVQLQAADWKGVWEEGRQSV